MIDFSTIRGETVEGQRSSFEQLVCHLAEFDGRGGEFRRIEGAGGDGGVEAIRILPNGREIGYQAKYHTSRIQIDWTKLDESIETALSMHPKLERYVVALPCYFTGKRAARGGSTEGVWGKWDNKVKDWKGLAVNHGMIVEFEPWTAFEIEVALLRPHAQHLIRFFFDQLVFTKKWMQRHLDRTIHDLQARYSPDEHVDTEGLKPFDVIYRRENILKDLHSIFELARQSNLRAAAALIENANVLEADITAAERLLKDFIALEEAVDWSLDKKWPISRWRNSWYLLTRELLEITRAISDRIPKENFASNLQKISNKTKAYEMTGPEVFGGAKWAYLFPIDEARATLFVGRAGAGKSHVLARGAETAWKEGAPVLHILGQHILDNDPRISILKRLEIADWSFHDALSALNLAAEAAGTRSLLVIDALNEGRGIEVWRNHLPSFICEVNKHDRIFLVMSCREEYLDYIVPKEVIAHPHLYPWENGQLAQDFSPLGKLVPVSVEGFRTPEEREFALQKFMDEKGIARPTAPVLDTEFFNPLFMTSVCRSMAKAEIKVFPRGLHGARDIFRFVLETKAKALGTLHDGTDRVRHALLLALNNLAGIMVERRKDFVPLHDTNDLINSAFEALPISDQTWLAVLEGSDILRLDIEKTQDEETDWSGPNEVVRFSFQRLQDNLIAERLLKDCHDIEAAFGPDGHYGFLIQRSIGGDGIALIRPNPSWIGVLGELWAAIADSYSKELFGLQSFLGSSDVHYYPHDFQPIFYSSLRERKGTSFIQLTKKILDRMWKDENEKKLSIILSFSCVPNHAWNADFLINRLFPLPLPDRDSVWSRWFTVDRSELNQRATEITDWALNVDPKIADAEVVRLAGITLAWLLASSNRIIRDRATKGLVNLMAGSPLLFPDLINQFCSIDDLYIIDRLLAAGYGAICLDPTEVRIQAAARAVVDGFFGRIDPPIHLSIRDWLRSILECAEKRDLVPPNFNVSLVRSSFGSLPPMLSVTKEELEKIVSAAGDDTIVKSCQQFYDFFKYVIEPEIIDFSETLLSEPPPLTQDERAERFNTTVREMGRNLPAKLDKLLSAVEAARKEELPKIISSKASNSISVTFPKRKKATEKKILKIENTFISSLPESLKARYKTELAPKIHSQFEPPKMRDAEPAGFWIARRAYELGWTKERFPQEPHNSGRSRPVIERIGKKYQWIALEEFMARQADNFWLKAGLDKGTRIYVNRQDILRRDGIDPTILPKKISHPLPSQSFFGPPPLFMEYIEDSDLTNWPFIGDHFDNPEPWLMGLLDSNQWLIAAWSESVNERHTTNDPSDPYRRQMQAFVSLVAHKANDREKVVDGFLRNHSRGIERWDLTIEPEGYLAFEVGLKSQEEIPYWKVTGHKGVDIATPIVTGFIENTTDRSIEKDIRYFVPHPRIQHAFGIRIPDIRDTGFWMLPDGQVFLRKLESRGSPLLLNREKFDVWCRTEGLGYTWVYIGERTAWTGRQKMKWRRTLGVAWFEGGKVKFKNDQRDN